VAATPNAGKGNPQDTLRRSMIGYDVCIKKAAKPTPEVPDTLIPPQIKGP